MAWAVGEFFAQVGRSRLIPSADTAQSYCLSSIERVVYAYLLGYSKNYLEMCFRSSGY